MRSSPILLTLLFASPLPAQMIVLRHANVIDGVSAQPLRGATVVVRDGHIESIVPGDLPSPANGTVFDLEGKWLLPGYIDAHVHIDNLVAARAAVRSGVTTVRSMGVSHFADVGIRDLHRAGAADLPDVIASGYHVRPQPASELFVDAPKLFDLMGKTLTTAADVRRIAQVNLDHGVQVMKILATERAGTPDTDPRKRTFSDEVMASVVDLAKSNGIPTAAHAHGDEGAAAAVRAGVWSIEHGTYLSDDTLVEMKRRGTYLDPTIATVIDLTDSGGDYDDPNLVIRGRYMLPRVREMTSHAWKMGVKIVTGTDTSYGPKSNRRIPHEIAELIHVGMPPMDAIKAATSVAAECLGISSRTGAIKPGLEADLVVIERDPMNPNNIDGLGDVLLVINDGKIALNRLKW
jgi:imidazolonepropionase-like amidohydrolase